AGQATVKWTAGPPAQLVVTPEQTLTRTVGQNARLIATVLDAYNNPGQGENVTFTLENTDRDDANCGDELKKDDTNKNGRVRLDHNASRSGTDTIKVTAGSLPEVTRTVVWEAGPVAQIELAAEPENPNPGDNVTIRATVKDANGNPKAGVLVTLISL